MGEGERRREEGQAREREAARRREREPLAEERKSLLPLRRREEREEGSGPSPQWNLGRRRRTISKERIERPRVEGRGEIWWGEERMEDQVVVRGEEGEEGEHRRRLQE